MEPASEPSGAQYYREDGQGATTRLTEEVMGLIDAEGPISFQKFFETVLYHPEWGYYARPQKLRTGKEGDFFTAISVGPLFGRIVAEYCSVLWEKMGKPPVFRIVEWGAEQGDLARDIFAGAVNCGPEFTQALQYAVVEPLPHKRRLLSESLPRVEVVADASELSSQSGLVIGNELVDALSFWLVERKDHAWKERRVGKSEAGFHLELAEPDTELRERLSLLEGPFEEGYQTEIRPSLAPLLQDMKRVLTAGEVLLFDYGFERNDLYHPSRTTGTLQTYGKHQSGEDPLVDLGQLDITAHVDFTALEEDAEAVGLKPEPLMTQGNFLTKAATALLTRMEGQVDPSFIRQFQTLTHPAQLGTKFSVFRASC